MGHYCLYFNLYRNGLSQKEILNQLGLTEEYKTHKETIPLVRNGGRLVQRWTWKRVVQEAKTIQQQEGMLPPTAWFQSNGHASLVQAIYNLNHTWEDLRQELADFNRTTFVESRNGLRWRSHPEASLSNFLYARGVEHKRGERYPDEYAQQSALKYGYYDLHFIGAGGVWIDVEIWGDNPGGHNEGHYLWKRQQKETFNESNPNFLGVHFTDCYEEEKLADILKPYIGDIVPFRFDKPTDSLIQTTHWSNADELLDYCSALAAQMSDGLFPTEGWLRKRGKWVNREGEALNTVSIYIKTWLGGMRNLRRLLGQDHASTFQWDRQSAIDAFQRFYETHGMTPESARRGTHLNSAINKRTIDEAGRICAAVMKYAGGSGATMKELGIVTDKSRKWTREAILAEFKDVIANWGMSPRNVRDDHRNGKLTLTQEEYQRIGQMLDAVGRQFSGIREVYKILEFTPPFRKRRRSKKSL